MPANSLLADALSSTAEAVEHAFDAVLPATSGPEARLKEAVRYGAMGGGKRMRPLLVVASSSLFQVDHEQAIRVGLAVECVHCYSLIHDDLPAMDDDDLRRGKPTVHKAYDEATAILAGDALLTKAFELLADPSVIPDADVRAALVLALAKASGDHGMVAGQAIDLAAADHELDLGGITRLQQLKTGALISFSSEAGAILGRAGAEAHQALRGYAHDLGLAFQIADDLLDVEGDVATVGKAVGKDADAGKATFVSLMGVDRARSQAKLLVEQAIDHLSMFGARAELLREIADFMVSRKN
ncbi:MAG: polyprenyl synthetase family protein [Pseudomonadota bacterium]